MIYPITAYGDPVLRKKAATVERDHKDLTVLVQNMFDTMYHCLGVGLAAPQVGISIRLFVVDATPFSEDEPAANGFKKVFINAQILEESGKNWKFNEGCLSIPGIREDIVRKDSITIRYQDINFETHTESYTGLRARIIQHEYDHIEGVLFTDYLTPLKKQLLKGRLMDISKGKADADYRMKFHKR